MVDLISTLTFEGVALSPIGDRVRGLELLLV